jgi:glycerol-3-phosphate O-acyltransferase
MFGLRYAWRRLRGRVHRMGAAGVAFGEPLSLSGWARERGAVEAGALAEEMMARVQTAMPVLPVPLVAALLRLGGPTTREALAQAVAAEAARLRDRGARVLLPGDDGVKAALTILVRRGFVREEQGVLAIVPEKAALSDYYAASVLPLLETGETAAQRVLRETVET